MVTQSTLISRVVDRLDAQVSKREVEDTVKAVFDEIFDMLAAGEEVQIPSFGKFEVRHAAARMGRNPQTGEAQQIPARMTPKFKPSSTLKRAVNDS